MIKKAYLYISLTLLLWSSTAAVAKLLLKSLNVFQLLLYVSLIASISLFVIIIFQNKIDVIRKYKFKDYCFFAFMGFIGIYLYHMFLFLGFASASVQEIFIVNYTWPIWVVIFGILILKEKISILTVLAISICFFGVYIVVSKGDLTSISFENIQGDFFALVGAISYGLFSVIGKKDQRDIVTSMMFYYFFSFIFAFITTLIFSTFPAITMDELIGLIWLGVFAMGIAFVFWFLALKHGNTAEMSNIIYLTPFISLIYIYFLIGEQILISSIFGLLLIIFGIYLYNNLKLLRKQIKK